MTQGNNKAIAILGAGFSGLRPGSQLVDKGFSVGICEKDPYVGGLLRTIEKNGFVMDLGPHIISPKEFGEHFSIKVPYSCPIYKIGYIGEVLKASKLIFNVENLFSSGRQRLFRYDCTTNPVMESADYVAKFIQTGKTKKEFLREPIAKALFF